MKKIWKKYLAFVVLITFIGVFPLHYRFTRWWTFRQYTIVNELDLLNGRSQCESAETSGSLLGERSLLKIAMDRNFTNLNKMAQQLICKRQNPKNCTQSRKLLCGQRARCGMGCELHHIGICLFLALGTNRTLILDTDVHTKRLLEHTYLPLSGTCFGITPKDLDNAAEISINGMHESTGDLAVVTKTITGMTDPSTVYAPFSFPDIFQEDLRNKTKAPHLWWIGQVMSYITTMHPAVSRDLGAVKRNIGFTHPIVGYGAIEQTSDLQYLWSGVSKLCDDSEVETLNTLSIKVEPKQGIAVVAIFRSVTHRTSLHVRRTDKKREADYQPLSAYMKHVTKWFDQYELAVKKKFKRKVFLVTDEMSILKEAETRYPGYEIISSREHITSSEMSTRRSEQSWRDVAEDVVLLSETDFLVCTFSSNIGRLAYELMMGSGPERHSAVASLDMEYYYTSYEIDKRIQRTGWGVEYMGLKEHPNV